MPHVVSKMACVIEFRQLPWRDGFAERNLDFPSSDMPYFIGSGRMIEQHADRHAKTSKTRHASTYEDGNDGGTHVQGQLEDRFLPLAVTKHPALVHERVCSAWKHGDRASRPEMLSRSFERRHASSGCIWPTVSERRGQTQRDCRVIEPGDEVVMPDQDQRIATDPGIDQVTNNNGVRTARRMVGDEHNRTARGHRFTIETADCKSQLAHTDVRRPYRFARLSFEVRPSVQVGKVVCAK